MNIKYLGYAFTVLGYGTYWIGRFFKKKSTMMYWNSLSSLWLTCQFICFGSVHGAINQSIVILRGISVNFKDRSEKPMHWLFWLFFGVYTVITVVFWEGIGSIFLLATMILNLFANWYMTPQGIRMESAVASVLYSVFLVCLGNYLALGFEATIIASNIASWIKHRKEGKTLCIKM